MLSDVYLLGDEFRHSPGGHGISGRTGRVPEHSTLGKNMVASAYSAEAAPHLKTIPSLLLLPALLRSFFGEVGLFAPNCTISVPYRRSDQGATTQHFCPSCAGSVIILTGS
jgi:hypothetical protein